MTERLFLDQPRLFETTATVLAAGPEGIVLDRTIFYARSGGQPGDTGHIGDAPIADTVKGEGETIRHLAVEGAALPTPGTIVPIGIDRDRRLLLMRNHTALHLLSALLRGAAVTGGAVGTDRSRLDFDLTDPPTKEAIEAGLNALVAAAHPVSTEWVEESVLDTNPELVRTLSVKPPRGAGRVRLLRIGADDPPVDLQPCGGTHVANTAEIGPVRVLKIENKGKQNRRITIALTP